jgi:hypothetical protein
LNHCAIGFRLSRRKAMTNNSLLVSLYHKRSEPK